MLGEKVTSARNLQGNELVIHLLVGGLHHGILIRRLIGVNPNLVDSLDGGKKEPTLPSFDGVRQVEFKGPRVRGYKAPLLINGVALQGKQGSKQGEPNN